MLMSSVWMKSTRPITARTRPKAPNPNFWNLKYGWFDIRAVARKASTARNKNVTPGTKKNTLSQVSPLSQCGNGRSHPPSHMVTAMDETAIMAEYSAKKNKDQRNPLYSVWKPAPSSPSASGKSKGTRLVSATIAMAKITNAIRPSGKNLKTNQVC